MGVLQNGMPPNIVDNPPFFDLLQGSKAAETGKVVVQAAIPYARGLSSAVDVTHDVEPNCEAPNLITRAKGNPGNASQGDLDPQPHSPMARVFCSGHRPD
jgi:hypothetical protein